MIFPRTDDRRRRAARACPRRSRPVGVLFAAIGLALLATACLPADLTAKLIVPATTDRVQGDGPLSSMWAAGKAKAACGLTPIQLTAMLIVPTSFESGTASPSPMTLSRWDNVNVWSLNVNLFPFSAATGPYTSAFYSPGIGLWQFDSAGGWNLTAATAIDTDTAAMQAATTISYRWCNAPADRLADPARRRAYAWGAWSYCTTDSRCEDAYNAILRNGKLDIGTDDSIDHLGGMERRTCTVIGLGENLPCHYIDPSRAQGSRSWTYGTYDPARPDYLTPLPKPFYDLEVNGNEYRIWIREDTGFDIGITATKPVTSNARTSLVWSRTSNLCDLTAQRGDCSGARVADTPWGPRSIDPFGSYDSIAVEHLNRVTVTGWAIDPDTDDAVPVDVLVDGVKVKRQLADRSRPDVATAVPGYGDEHGFVISTDVSAGDHSVCVTAVNIGDFGTEDKSMGCQTVTISGDPIGALQKVTPAVGGVTVRGYALDADTQGPLTVRILADDQLVATTIADITRNDIVADNPTFGPDHGFQRFVRLSAGLRRVCAIAVNLGPNGVDRSLGCISATVDGQPIGSFDALTAAPGGIRVWGWAFDPETADARVRVTIDGTVVRSMYTTTQRPDVAAVYPNLGSAHGFNAIIPTSPGSHSVCLTILNVGAAGSDASLGCRTVTVPTGPPFGNLEFASRGYGGVILKGWVIDTDSAAPVTVKILVNGVVAKTFTASDLRPDVGAAYPGYGDAHGFFVYTPISPAPTTVCLQMVNIGPSTPDPTLWCRVY